MTPAYLPFKAARCAARQPGGQAPRVEKVLLLMGDVDHTVRNNESYLHGMAWQLGLRVLQSCAK